MSRPKRRESYETLKKVWYAKLKASGFDDIEEAGGKLKGDDDVHMDGEPRVTRTPFKGFSSLVWKQSQAEYYRLASFYLHDGRFQDSVTRRVWELHCEGKGIPFIVRATGLSRMQVRWKIQNIRVQAGIFDRRRG